jgi:hypothetical protein
MASVTDVNFGGTGKLPMSDLKAMCESIGFQKVRTYIASGNVVFRSAWSELDGSRALLLRASDRWDVSCCNGFAMSRGIGRVFAALHGTADLSQHGFPAHGDLDWYQPGDRMDRHQPHAMGIRYQSATVRRLCLAESF